MRNFIHIDAKTVDEATSALTQYGANAWPISGGTDLLGTMKFFVLPDYPEALVNLKTISPSLDYINEEQGVLKIGALTHLEDIAKNSIIQDKYTALAQAAQRTASPHIREQGTIGGNICQSTRCWYFHKPNNRFHCIRKEGGVTCYAVLGENRYHSIFGGIIGCFCVNPSDIAPALVALNAKIVTSARTIDAENFWEIKIPRSTTLNEGEIVTEIQVPTPSSGVKSSFLKYAIRTSIDFPIVNCAATIGDGDARICLNAVYPLPYRVNRAEDSIKGKSIDVASAEAAGSAAVTSAVPMTMNKWKIQIAKTLVKRTILLCEPGGAFAEFQADWECG